MTTDWVTATKSPVGQSGEALTSCSVPGKTGQGRPVSDLNVGWRNTWRMICSSDSRFKDAFNAGCFTGSESLHVLHPLTSIKINMPLKNPSILQANQWKHNTAGYKILANFTVCVHFNNQGDLPLPGDSVWQLNLHRYQGEDEEIEFLIHILYAVKLYSLCNSSNCLIWTMNLAAKS